MKRAAQTALVLSAIGCALVLSATATVALAAFVDVPGWAHPFAVGMLEVVSVTGTWLWVTDRRMRGEAAVAVLLASAVTGYAGVHAYGAFGLVAPIGLIVTVHLVSRAWTVDTAPERVQATITVDETHVAAPDDETLAIDSPSEGDRLATVRQIVAGGGGRGTVAAELGITPAQARGLIEKVKAA